ncbi:MAG: hypothetical protein Q8R81_02135 [Novosphingobium sp.]|nr:hypothetical protein [Novosphingobium sp.]MDP3549176.1 hypothetical protein [Novosphingobium sp.]
MTHSLSIAIRMSRKVAADIDAMVEAKRLEIGLAVEGRLLPPATVPQTVTETIKPRSERAPAMTTGMPLSQVYHRYLGDPTKRRSARTMLAHQTGFVTVLRRSPMSIGHLGFEGEWADAAQI